MGPRALRPRRRGSLALPTSLLHLLSPSLPSSHSPPPGVVRGGRDRARPGAACCRPLRLPGLPSSAHPLEHHEPRFLPRNPEELAALRHLHATTALRPYDGAAPCPAFRPIRHSSFRCRDDPCPGTARPATAAARGRARQVGGQDQPPMPAIRAPQTPVPACLGPAELCQAASPDPAKFAEAQSPLDARRPSATFPKDRPALAQFGQPGASSASMKSHSGDPESPSSTLACQRLIPTHPVSSSSPPSAPISGPSGDGPVHSLFCSCQRKDASNTHGPLLRALGPLPDCRCCRLPLPARRAHPFSRRGSSESSRGTPVPARARAPSLSSLLSCTASWGCQRGGAALAGPKAQIGKANA